MILTRIFLLFLGILFSACDSRQPTNATPLAATEKDPQVIINRAIEVHGGKKFEAISLSFDFRDKHYSARRKKGQYTYTRSFTDSTGQVKDILTNDGFTRTINNVKQALPAKQVKAFTASVNSVIYFALLPYGLNDPAVRKQFLGTITIKKTPYFKIKVTFDKEGGGEDFQEQYLYWINQKTGTMDYFAYTVGGIRFRQAINPQIVKGIWWQDYINYKTLDSVNYLNIDKQFEAGQLKEFSRIELKNIEVDLL